LLLASFTALNNFIAKNSARSNVDNLVTLLQYGRNIAIAKNINVIFCKSLDHKTCGGNWNDGQILITEDNILLRSKAASHHHDKLIWQSSLGENDSITFTPSGTKDGQQGSFFFCPHGEENEALAIIIEQTGRIRVSDKTASGEIIPCS